MNNRFRYFGAPSQGDGGSGQPYNYGDPDEHRYVNLLLEAEKVGTEDHTATGPGTCPSWGDVKVCDGGFSKSKWHKYFVRDSGTGQENHTTTTGGGGGGTTTTDDDEGGGGGGGSGSYILVRKVDQSSGLCTHCVGTQYLWDVDDNGMGFSSGDMVVVERPTASGNMYVCTVTDDAGTTGLDGNVQALCSPASDCTGGTCDPAAADPALGWPHGC